jgi:hypothetical protein
MDLDSFYGISYKSVERWYRENKEEVDEIVQRKYMITQTPPNINPGKVDLTHGYMVSDITYYIVLLRRVMGLGVAGHLETWMVHFIEKIRTSANSIDWAPYSGIHFTSI